MRKVIWWLIVIFGMSLFVTIAYYALLKLKPEPASRPPAPAVAQPPVPIEPQTRFPVTPQPGGKPLPALDVSDPTLKSGLEDLCSDKTLVGLFQLQNFVRRVVATVDNLPREKLALRLLPVKPAVGRFLVTGKNGDFTISAENPARYAVYLRLANALSTENLVALYIRFYPLFERAYIELGYLKGHFNDRLIEVIDHLLAAPDMKAPVKLVQPKVFYLFADARLETLSAGQKLLMRVGSENAALIKQKLRDLRGELLHQISAESRPSADR